MVTMKSLLVLNGSTDTLSPWGQHMPSATMYVKKTIVFDTRRSLLRIALTYVTKELWRRRSMFLINHPCATAPMFCIFDPAYTSQSRWALHTIIKIPACGVPDAILGVSWPQFQKRYFFSRQYIWWETPPNVQIIMFMEFPFQHMFHLLVCKKQCFEPLIQIVTVMVIRMH